MKTAIVNEKHEVKNTSFVVMGGVFDTQPLLDMVDGHASPHDMASTLDDALRMLVIGGAVAKTGEEYDGIRLLNLFDNIRMLRDAFMVGGGMKKLGGTL